MSEFFTCATRLLIYYAILQDIPFYFYGKPLINHIVIQNLHIQFGVQKIGDMQQWQRKMQLII